MTQEERRKAKYPNTDTFKYYNANPKNKLTGDCVIRAIATALEQDYIETYKELFEYSLKTGYMINDPKNYTKYLSNKGWITCKSPRHKDNTKFSGVEFCKKLALPKEKYIAKIGSHHITAIINCKINDIWDASYCCIGNYWVHAGEKV